MSILKQQYSNTKLRGFSLIELLISITLGLILTSGVITVFSSNKRSSDLNAAMSSIQENARYALELIGKDVQMAGYIGCAELSTVNLPVIANPPLPLSLGTTSSTNKRALSNSAISGSVITAANSWVPAVPGDGYFEYPTEHPGIVGTHVLMTQYGSSNSSPIAKQMESGGLPSASGPIEASENLNIEVDDLLLISTCESADLFRATAATSSGSGQTIEHTAARNTQGNLSKSYGDLNTINDTKIMKLVSNLYYIGDTQLTNSNGDKITALYRQSLPFDSSTNPPTELMQGVDNMQIAFGVRNNGSLQYILADDADFDSSSVESVQIGLLMSSWDRVLDDEDETTYTLAGQSIPAQEDSSDATTHAKDKRYRLAFNTTIKVRNRR